MKSFVLLLALLFSVSTISTALAQNQADSSTKSVDILPKKPMIIKFHFLSPAFGHCAFGVEKMLAKSVSISGNIGYIGVPSDIGKGKMGFHLTAQPRLYLVERSQKKHPLRGIYMGLSASYAGFHSDIKGSDYYYDPNTQTSSMQSYTIDRWQNSGAVTLDFGIQVVIKNVVSLDFMGGVGYGFYSYTEKVTGPAPVYDYNSRNEGFYNYSYIVTGQNVPLAFRGNFTVGYIFN